MRFVSSSFSSALILATSLATIASATAVAGVRVNPGPGVRVLSARQGTSTKDAVDALERAGYHVDVAIVPDTYFVRAMSRAASAPAGFEDVTPAALPAIAAPAAPFAAPPAGLLTSTAEWTAALGSEAPVPDLLLPPVTRPSRLNSAWRGAPGTKLPSGLAYGTRWTDTSELMVGRVAVPIIFPESDGTLDPNHYDWTPALRDSIIRSAVRGFLKWSSIAASHGVPLTFVLEVEPVAPTRYEPIDHPVADEALWIAEALEPLVGHKGDAVAMSYEVANGARARLGTQWAALLIAVQNDTDPDGKFSDMVGEHAVLGGPYFVVMVQQSNATGGAALDFYVSHEVTHMFWALDEYPASNAWWGCSVTTGYFNQPNTNADVPAPGYCYGEPPNNAPSRRHCFMKDNYPDSLCPPTQRQIGWVDLDGDGTPDLFETRPTVIPDSSHYFLADGVPLLVRGAAADVALPNRNPYHFGAGDSITMATVDSIWQRLDGGPWVPVAPDDGIFDEGSERFQFVVPSPGTGNHLLEFQARNSNDLMLNVPASAVITVSSSTTGVDVPDGNAGPAVPTLSAGPNPSSGPVQFTLRGRHGAHATARVFDVSGRLVRAWSMTIAGSGKTEWAWDGRLPTGGTPAGGLYFLVVEIGSERLTRRVVILH
ncbi:MAG: T9SS type A sorting domain-containing protein [Candidatus Eiseniibacteriota bacterium]